MNKLYLIVKLAGELVAFPASAVDSVVKLDDVTAVPHAAPHVAGISALRSHPLTVIDCARALGLEASGPAGESRFGVVVKLDGHLYALDVNEVHDVVEASGDPEAVPVDLGAQWGRVGSRMIETVHGAMLVIDLAGMIAGQSGKQAA